MAELAEVAEIAWRDAVRPGVLYVVVGGCPGRQLLQLEGRQVTLHAHQGQLSFIDHESAAPLLRLLECPSWKASEHRLLHGLPEAAPHGSPIMRIQGAARVRQALQVADQRALGRWLWVSIELAQWMIEHWDAVQAGSVEVDVEVGQ